MSRLLSLLACAARAEHTFDIRSDKFYVDGTPTIIVSGSIHYSRVHPKLWPDRLARARAMGLNSITTYVPWNFHEPIRGEYDFMSPWRDLAGFIKLAGQHGLFVILRGGPYMCGEWEFGGLPAWLLANGTLPLRTFAQPYISHVDAYWSRLMPVVAPLLFHRGGPVIMFQVENEYGSYGDTSSSASDRRYMEHLIATARAGLGAEALLFTTDGGDAIAMLRGSIAGPSVLTVGDGCGDPAATWAAQKKFNPSGGSPFLCAELYPGWLTHWGEPAANISSAKVVAQLEEVLSTADGWGSASLYMVHGGTSFAWWSGANNDSTINSYQPDITSYDYNSPIAEGGEHGIGLDGRDKFAAIAATLTNHTYLDRMRWFGQPPGSAPVPPPGEPPLLPRAAIGAVALTQIAPLLEAAHVLEPQLAASGDTSPPAGVETVGCFGGGFALFEAEVATGLEHAGARLTLPELHDRALVFVRRAESAGGDHFVGTIYRTESAAYLEMPAVPPGARIAILLELLGRINFSHGMDDARFGLLGGVRLDGVPIRVASTGWSTRCLDMGSQALARLTPVWRQRGSAIGGPAFFRATFESAPPARAELPQSSAADAYLYLPGFVKGAVWINGFALGRYWNVQGPQHTLYVPAPILRAHGNEMIVLELHNASADATVNFVPHPIWRDPPAPQPWRE